MQTAQIIPFDFEQKNVRIINVNDNPWFCLRDVCAILDLNQNRSIKAFRFNEEGAEKFSTPSNGGNQEQYFISEGNAFRLIARSNKPEAIRMERWIFDEVLPSIRRTGRYEDATNRMATLVDELIGMSELGVIKGLIRDKGKAVPAEKRQSFAMTLHNRLHTRFNVPRTELIPADQFEVACNFIAAYTLEGEWLPKPEKRCGTLFDDYQLYDVYFVCHHFGTLYEIFKRHKLYSFLKTHGSRAGVEMIDHFKDGSMAVWKLSRDFGGEFDAVQSRLRLNQHRAHNAAM